MNITRENIKEVLTSSMEKPLFLFFYTDDPDCQAAKNTVTTAISETNEFVTLALCDVADQAVQMLAMQIQLQGVPSLVVVDQGNPVAILQGDEEINARLQETLNQYMPSEAKLMAREALQAEASGNLSEACSKAGKAYNLDPKDTSIKYIYARLLIAQKNTTKAHELLDNAGREEKSSPEYQQLIAALTLAEQAQNSPELLELEAKYEADPSDDNAVAYAVALADSGKKEEALKLLFDKLKQDLSKETIKKTFLDILSTMDGDKLQSTYRRRLYTLMY